MADMSEEAMVPRLRAFLHEKIGRHLGRREQKESFATYAMGIVGEGTRKSVEPIAARATGDARKFENMQARLLNFLRDSPWSESAVRLESTRHVASALEAQEPVTTWIIDDTGFPKQGKHSVGVQRQYRTGLVWFSKAPNVPSPGPSRLVFFSPVYITYRELGRTVADAYASVAILATGERNLRIGLRAVPRVAPVRWRVMRCFAELDI